MKHIRTTDLRARRRGFMSMELALTLPILGLVLLALFEFSVLFFARGEVVESCRVGARIASQPGVNEYDVENEVKRVLSPRLRRYAQVDIRQGQYSGDLISVRVRVPMDRAAPNLLWPIGYSLKGRELVGAVQLVKE